MNDNFGMFDGYENFDYYAYESAATAGLAIVGIFFLLAIGLSIAMYLFQAIGLYRMAKRLNIAAPALAFIPVANIYVLGRTASEPVDGKKKLPYGWILLGLTILSYLISLSSLIELASAVIRYGERADMLDVLESLVLTSMAKGFLASAASIAYTVFYYIALYHLYNNFNPNNSTLLLVLSIFFGFLVPIFIFANRNKPIGGANAGGFGQGYNGYYGGFAPNPNGYNPNFNQGYNQYTPNANQGYTPNQTYSGGYDPAYGNQGFPPYQTPQQPQTEAPQQPTQGYNDQQ